MFSNLCNKGFVRWIKHQRMQPWFFLFDELTHLAVVKETGGVHSFHLHTCLERMVVLFLKAMLYEMAKGLVELRTSPR